jgi:hypothetical protein
MKAKKYISLTGAKYLKDYQVELQFSDNVVRQIDFGNFLQTHSHPQFDKYKELRKFRKFKIDGNNIVWGKYYDLIFDITKLYKGINPN